MHTVTPKQMASVYKRRASAVWQCQYYVIDSTTGEIRKVRKSTGTRNRKQAVAVAVELERAGQAVIRGSTEESQRARSVLADAIADIERGVFTAPTARKYVGELLRIATGEVLHAFTIESWSNEWLRRKEIGSTESTMARYRGHVAAWLEWLGDTRKVKPLESVTTTDASRWRESLKAQGRAGKTVLSYTKDIGAVYRSALREGIVSFNPFSALDAVDTSDSHERKPFTGEEVGRLLGAAPSEEWRGLILAAAFTGLRLGDAARLRWSSVDLQERRIVLIPSKSKKRKREVRIPIQPDLLAYLASAPVIDDSPGAPVFPKLSRTAVGARTGLSQTFNRIMETAGVSRGKPSREIKEGEEKGVGRITWERGFHSLRHTFTTWLRTAGVSEEDRMALTGHTTREVHATYSHADDEALRAAIAKLPSIE